MLQHTTFSSTAVDLPQTDLRHLLGSSRVGRVVQFFREMFWLPNNMASFLLFLAIISLLTAGLMLHLRLSVQILETKLLLESKQQYHVEIQRQNAEIVWQIGQAMSLEHVRRRASTLGYVVPTKRYYVALSSQPLENAASPATPSVQIADDTDASLPGVNPSQNSFRVGSEFVATIQRGWQDLSHQITTWWQGS